MYAYDLWSGRDFCHGARQPIHGPTGERPFSLPSFGVFSVFSYESVSGALFKFGLCGLAHVMNLKWIWSLNSTCRLPSSTMNCLINNCWYVIQMQLLFIIRFTMKTLWPRERCCAFYHMMFIISIHLYQPRQLHRSVLCIICASR